MKHQIKIIRRYVKSNGAPHPKLPDLVEHTINTTNNEYPILYLRSMLMSALMLDHVIDEWYRIVSISVTSEN